MQVRVYAHLATFFFFFPSYFRRRRRCVFFPPFPRLFHRAALLSVRVFQTIPRLLSHPSAAPLAHVRMTQTPTNFPPLQVGFYLPSRIKQPSCPSPAFFIIVVAATARRYQRPTRGGDTRREGRGISFSLSSPRLSRTIFPRGNTATRSRSLDKGKFYS